MYDQKKIKVKKKKQIKRLCEFIRLYFISIFLNYTIIKKFPLFETVKSNLLTFFGVKKQKSHSNIVYTKKHKMFVKKTHKKKKI